MLVVGVTGGVGTGKSSVSRIFRSLGAHVLDADRITHDLMKPRRQIWRQIRRQFGPESLLPNRQIDRRRLGQEVFESPAKLKRLTRIIHPAVRKVIARELIRLRRKDPEGVVVLDVPLLIEAGSHYRVDFLVVVWAPLSVAVRRLQKRSGWSAAEVRRRSRFQMPLREKEKQAHFVVKNGGSLEATRRQVVRIWKQIKERC